MYNMIHLEVNQPEPPSVAPGVGVGVWEGSGNDCINPLYAKSVDDHRLLLIEYFMQQIQRPQHEGIPAFTVPFLGP